MKNKILAVFFTVLVSVSALARPVPKVVVRDSDIDSYMVRYKRISGVKVINLPTMFIPVVKNELFKRLKKQTPASVPAMKILMTDVESAIMMEYSKSSVEIQDRIETAMCVIVGVKRSETDQNQFLFAASPDPSSSGDKLNRIIMYDGTSDTVVVFRGNFTRKALDGVLAYQPH